ncbi:MAG: DUF4136 domain-containing protein, partial [Chitinophagaceae bacterium]
MRKYLSLALVIMAAGCSSVKVLNSETGDGANLNSYKTFDFFTVEAKGDTSTSRFGDRVNKLEDAIALEMQHRGYLLSKTNPDLLVNIGIVVNEEVQTRQTDFRTDAPKYIGQRRYSWKSQDVEVGRYREGTVTVHLVDNRQNKMVWRGAVQGVISNNEARVEKA